MKFLNDTDHHTASANNSITLMHVISPRVFVH